ncbi:MAG: GMC family oxidoreductase [Acidimicrobiales bacterium]
MADVGSSGPTFDVVVIGAGSSGSVIAARASENPNLTVALVEAGPDYPALAETPWDLVNSHDNSYVDHDWRFSYTPASTSPATAFPRGRVTGGSSAVNTTIALRGMPEDYDGWAAAGNPEWAWPNVLRAFCRMERDLDFGDAPFHGDAGPISIRRYPESEMTEPQQAFLAAADDLGYPACPDANDPDGWGAGPHPMNKLGRVRISTAVGYLAPARVRPNLTILPDRPVRRLLLEGKRVTGVEVDGPNGTERVHGRVVVLSAGAIQSPAILMRSGIGPKGQLDGLGLDAVAEVAGVGQNLCDHPAVAVVAQARDASMVDRDLPIIQNILRYTAPGSEHRNDLQIEPLTFAGRAAPGAALFGIAAVLEHTYGRGQVRLASADPSEGPLIEPHFGEDERDNSRLAACLLDTVRFLEAAPIADLVEEVHFPRLPLTLDGAMAIVAKRAGSGYHPCGTCRMGPEGDAGAVVDQYGRCHTVDGLVVADASIMPEVPRANTNLTAIMIGEMVGEWVRTEPSRFGL